MHKTATSSFGVVSRSNHDSTQFYKSNLYEGIELKTVDNKIQNRLSSDKLNQIYLHSSEKMSELPENCIHLMITSPPYNVTKDYDKNLTLTEYLELLSKVFQETYRVLVNGGRACINIANVGRKPYIPYSDYISQIMSDIGFNNRGEIIWDKAASSGGSCAWGSWMSASNPILRDIHEYILIFSKGDLKREKGESTISRDDFLEWTKSIWRMNTVSAKKIGHPAPFPEELPHRLINLFSYKNDIILDPFMGAGTTAVAAIKNNRYFIGYEITEEYKNLADKRINEINSSLFKYI